MTETIKVKLINKTISSYSLYLFQNQLTQELVMCTALPNWKIPFIEINDIGYAKIETVLAGQEYFDAVTETFQRYKYSNIYLLNYIGETSITETGLIL